MIFEDVHWIDPTSRETLGRIIERIKTLSVLLIVTYRPEFESQWKGGPHVTALTLNRFGKREIATMIDRVAGNKLLPASIKQDIIERSDGIPCSSRRLQRRCWRRRAREQQSVQLEQFRRRLLRFPEAYTHH
jgi:predicted ATPase